MRGSRSCWSRRQVAALLAVAGMLAGPGRVAAAECWPPPVAAPVADPFREPACRWCEGNRGIEYATPADTTVRAVAGGVVSFSGVVAGTRYVVVEHPDGRRATYGGLAQAAVRRGDQVVTRRVIGRTAEHLHFGLREGSVYVDPAPYLGRAVYPTRLVPLDGSPAPAPGPAKLVCEQRSSAAEYRPTTRVITGRNHPTVR